MINIESVSKVFTTPFEKIKAVDAVSLQVNRGEIFGIIGLSGAGKSTLIRLINGLESTSSGRISIDSIDIHALSKKNLNSERHQIGMIFQHFNLLSSRNVMKNVMFPLEISGMNKHERMEVALNMLSRVGLSDKVNARVTNLSGGQKQRVAIARALVNQPKLLLCDEATSALDPKTTLEILGLLKELRDQFGLTIILITHQMEVIEAICDKVAFMEDGKILGVESLNRESSKSEELKTITDKFFKIKVS